MGPTKLSFSKTSPVLRDMSLAARTRLVLKTYQQIDETTGCWLWTGAKLPTGHGQTRIAGKCYLVHRLSAMLWLGLDITNRYMGSRRDASQVNHKPECPNTNCFNPDHLYIGTQGENMRDKPEEKRKHPITFPYTCKRGHVVTPELYGPEVGCLECRRFRQRKAYNPVAHEYRMAYQRNWRAVSQRTTNV